MTSTNNHFLHKLPDNIPILHGRHPYIVEKCRGKRVLHVGCVDTGIMEERFMAGELLHQKLANVCSYLHGIDINNEGINFLRNKGVENVSYADIQDAESLKNLTDINFDIIILSEVIEHLPNVSLALTSLKSLSQPNHTEFLISVPNAFSLPVLLSLINNIEHVHPDHNCYFSYTTLRNTLRKSGYNITNEMLYTFQPRNHLPENTNKNLIPRFKESKKIKEKHNFVKRVYWEICSHGISCAFPIKKQALKIATKLLFRKSPHWAEGLMFVCKTQKGKTYSDYKNS